jgi:glycine cleavage system H protein
VSGEVIEVNNDLSDSPELVNESPYEKGWMIKVKIDDVKELEKLMDSSAYEKSL